MRVVIDADMLLYAAASVCETRQVKITHKATGKSKLFANRTEFFGRGKTEGELQKANHKRKTQYTKDDYEVEDIQTVTDPDAIPKILKGMVGNVLDALKFNEFTDSYVCYTGTGKTFRHELATILEYKAGRPIKPLMLPKAREYLLNHLNGVLVQDIEADDAVQIEGVKGYYEWKRTGDDDDKVIVVSGDKDAKTGPFWLYNPDKDKEARLIEGYGKLLIDEKGDVDGYGRVWLYYQCLSGDSTDNFKANSASDTRWGSKAAYKALKDCTTDEEALKVLVDSYKMLYPEPKKIIGWRGQEIEIDWLYVLQENFDLCRMLREKDDAVNIIDVLRRFKIET